MEQRVINTPAAIYLESRKRAKASAANLRPLLAMVNVDSMCICIVELEREVSCQYEQWKRDHRVL